MNENKYPSCEERIDAELERTLEGIRSLVPDGADWYRCEGCNHVWASDDYPSPDECPECGGIDFEDSEPPEDQEIETREEWLEGLLDFRKAYEVWRVQMSTGGPGDDFWLYVDPEDHEIERIEYSFLDWFDGARRELRGDDFELVKELFQPYVEM